MKRINNFITLFLFASLNLGAIEVLEVKILNSYSLSKQFPGKLLPVEQSKLAFEIPGKIKIINVPGVFEIPVIISKNLKKFDAFIALGCVIKGQTPHFDFISMSSTNAIMDLAINSKKPIGNGIITCLNKKQAIARGKKGLEASEAVKVVLTNK